MVEFYAKWHDAIQAVSTTGLDEKSLVLDLHVSFHNSLGNLNLSSFLKKKVTYLCLGVLRTLQLEARIKSLIGYKGIQIHGFNHHRCHAELYKFCEEPVRRVVTWDGRGEFDTAVLWDVNQNTMLNSNNPQKGERGKATPTMFGEVTRISTTQHPHSLGSFYAIFAVFLGFDLLSGPGKLMGLAPYGEFDQAIDGLISNSINCHERDFKFELSSKVFEVGDPEPLALNSNTTTVLGPTREPNTPFNATHRNIAWSVQRELERAATILCKNGVKDLPPEDRSIFFSGGVALNCVMNARLRDELQNILFLPCSGDDGLSLGAASLMRMKLSRKLSEPFANVSRNQGTPLG